MYDVAYEINHELLNDCFGFYKKFGKNKNNDIDFKHYSTNLYLRLYEYSEWI